MQRLFSLAAVVCLAVAGGLPIPAGQPINKRPVPDTKALGNAEELVNDIFKEEIAKAVDAEARTKLAVNLAQQGDESADDPAARYVLYCQAKNLAVLAGNPALTMSTIDKIAQYFEVSAIALKTESLAKLVDTIPTKEPSKKLTDLTLALIAEAVDADDYHAATELGKVATAAAKKAQVIALVNTVGKRNAEIQAAKEKFNVLQAFVDRLAKDPDDAEANLKLGEYFGLFKGKWDRAVPHLARSKTEPLANLAKQDLAKPKEAKDQAALADAWWDFAAKQPEPQQTRLQERAAYWYSQALPGLAGLSRTKAQKRAGQVSARSEGATVAIDGPAGFLRALDGHSGEIRALAISHDGRFGLSGSVDNSLRLWDLDTGKELRSFRGHTKQVWGVAFVPGTKHVLSASWDGTVKLWDSATGDAIHTFSHPLDVNGLAVSEDGKWMLTGSDDKHMRLWDLAKYEEVKKFAAHNNFCYACAFAPNRLYAASGSADKRAVVFELATGKVVREVEQANAVFVVMFSPDSKYLFTCGDNAAHMWDVTTGREEKKFEGTSGYITGMGLTPDGRRLVTGGEDKTVRVWDVGTGKESTRFAGNSGAITAVAVSQDGRRALTGQSDGIIRYWGLPAH
jgi:WD40 repeat protein